MFVVYVELYWCLHFFFCLFAVVRYTKTSQSSTPTAGGGVKLVVGSQENPIEIPSTPQVDLSNETPVVVPPMPSVLLPGGAPEVSIAKGGGAAGGAGGAAGGAGGAAGGAGGAAPGGSGGFTATISSHAPGSPPMGMGVSSVSIHPHSHPSGGGSSSSSGSMQGLPGQPTSVHIMRFGDGPGAQGGPHGASGGPVITSSVRVTDHYGQGGPTGVPHSRGVQVLHVDSEGTPEGAAAGGPPQGQGQMYGAGAMGHPPMGSAPTAVYRVRFGDNSGGQQQQQQQQQQQPTHPGATHISFGVEGPQGPPGTGGGYWRVQGGGDGGGAAAGAPGFGSLQQRIGTPDPNQLFVPGFNATSVTLSGLPFYATMGQVPQFGARFHGIQPVHRRDHLNPRP